MINNKIIGDNKHVYRFEICFNGNDWSSIRFFCVWCYCFHELKKLD